LAQGCAHLDDDDDVGGWDDLDWDGALQYRLPTPLLAPTRHWTDEDWAIICQWSEGAGRKSRWKGVVTTGRRLRLYPRAHRAGAFEAVFVRGDDGWTITGLVLYRNPYMSVRRDQATAFAESLIESIVRGDEDLAVGVWLSQREAFRMRHDVPADNPGLQRSPLAGVAEQQATQTSKVHAPTTPTGDTMSACLLCQYKIPLLDTTLGPAGSPVGLCRKCSSLSCGWHGARTPPPAFLCLLCDGTNLLASAAWQGFVQRGGLNRLPTRGQRNAAPGARGRPAMGADDDEAAADLARALAGLFSTADGYPSPFVVASLEQWLDERPSYRAVMGALVHDSDWAIRQIDTYLGGRSGTAGYEADTLSSEPVRTGPRHYGIGPIGLLWGGLHLNGRRLLAAAALLMVALEIPEDLMPPPVADVATLIGGMLRRDHPERIGLLRSWITAQQ
jgi:hypothetical protein